jgi:Tfp pilus assembly protein PilV
LKRRGALLLEALLSLALFSMTALAVLSIVRQSIGRLEDAELRLEAADLARSAMSVIEAGLVEPAAIAGPVPEGGLLAEADADSGGVDMNPDIDSEWLLDIETEPSAFDGLTEVAVTARRVSLTGVERTEASFTLRQLVRLDATDGPGGAP